MRMTSALSCSVLLAASPAATQTLAGNDVLQACSMADNLAAEGFCLGYIVGAIEGLKWGAASIIAQDSAGLLEPDELDLLSSVLLGFCIPDTASNGQLKDVVVKHLQDNPATRHETARTLVQVALSAGFPCT